MNNSIVFLGKFDQKMLPIEKKVINTSKHYKARQKSINYNQGEMPDVVKYTIDDYDCDVWIPLGDVKPTLLLKDLISKSKIIFFVFYFDNHETLDYLKEGWGPIIKKVNGCLKDKQERILIGINSGSNSNQRKIKDLISSTMSFLNCNCFYEECTVSKLSISKTVGSFTVITDLIEYIKPIITIQTSKNEVKETESNESKRTCEVNEITMDDKLLNLKEEDGNDEQKEKGSREQNKKEFIKKDGNNSTMMNNKLLNLIKKDGNDEQKEKKSIEHNEKNSIMMNNKLLNLKEEDGNDGQKEKEKVLVKQNENNNTMISKKLLKLAEVERNNEQKEKRSKEKELIEQNGSNNIMMSNKLLNIIEENDVTINNICYTISDKFQSAKIKIVKLKHYIKVFTFQSHIKFEEKDYEITEICDKAFANSTIESLSFSNDSKLNKIGSFSFENSKIQSLSISNNVKFCDFCFKNCKNLSIISLNNVSFIEISNNCFAGCDSLSQIIIKSKSPQLRISKGNFLGIKNLDTIEIEAQNLIIEDNCFKELASNSKYSQKQKSISMKISSNVDIGNNCFNELNVLESIIIKAENLSIKNECFNEIKNLKNLNFECKQIKIGENCFKNSINNNKQLDENLVSEYNIVRNCNSNKFLIISQSEIEIGNFSFFGQNLVDLVEMAAKSINIGKECFNKCQFLTKIKITSSSSIKIFENSFLDLLILEEIILNSNQIMIKDNCFHNSLLIQKEKYYNMKTNKSSYYVYGNNSITANTDIEIGSFCFYRLNIHNSIEIVGENIKIGEKFIIDCNYLAKINMKTNSSLNILKNSFCNLELLKNFVIEGQQLMIDNDCFNNCFIVQNSNYNELTIKSSSDVEIRKQCFNLNKLLGYVSITGKNIIIKDCCFNQCESLKSIKISNSEKIIFGCNVFSECTNLKKLFLKSTFIYLDKECFSTNNNKIEAIEIECSEVTIDENCFKDNLNIKSIMIKKTSSINIHNYAFVNCQKLKSIQFESSNISIGEGCFMNCQKLSSFESKTTKNILIKTKSFEMCEELNKFSIINGNEYTFENEILIKNPKLATFEIKGDSIRFSNSISNFCSNLKKINIEINKPIKITNLTFTECKSITDIILSNKSTIEIAQESFKELCALNVINLNSKEIIIGERCFINSFSVMSKSNKYLRVEAETLILGDSCFKNCQYLSSFNCNNLKSLIIGQNAFDNCISMERFYFKSTLIDVKNGCFSGCIKLSSVSFNCDELTIGDNCFNNCVALSNLFFNGIKVARIGANVIFGCQKLDELTLRVSSKLTLNDECFSFAKNFKKITIEADEINTGCFIFKNCDSINHAVFKYRTAFNLSETEFKKFNPKIKCEIVQIKK